MKTAVIIGATSGIGREVAIQLIEEGWKVGIAGRREDRLLDIQGKYGSERVAIAKIDITREEATLGLDALLAETGAPDVFLHVSGMGRQNREMDEETEVRIIDTNCSGMVRMVSHFFNYAKGHPEVYNPGNKAHIAVVTSVAGTNGMGVSTAYSASKKMQSTYLVALTQLCRMEHIPIRFTDIRPGFVDTEILAPGHHYPFLMTVEKAAGYLIRGLKKRRRIVIFDWRYRVLTGVWRLIPRWLWERFTWVKA